MCIFIQYIIRPDICISNYKYMTVLPRYQINAHAHICSYIRWLYYYYRLPTIN